MDGEVGGELVAAARGQVGTSQLGLLRVGGNCYSVGVRR